MSSGHGEHCVAVTLPSPYTGLCCPASQLPQARVPLGAEEHGEIACRPLSLLPTYTVKPSPLTAGEEYTQLPVW